MISRISLALLIGLFAFAASVSAQGTKDTSSRPKPEPRDLNFERKVSDRYNELLALLPPEATTKLNAAAKALITELVKARPPADPSPAARRALGLQFTGLTKPQADVLSFMIMAQVARLTAARTDGTPDADPNNVLPVLTEPEWSRLKPIVLRKSKYNQTMGKIMERYDQSAKNVIQSMRG